MAAKEGRCLGLIGGLGPPATVYYYRELLAAHAAQGRSARMLIAHADIERIRTTIEAKNLSGLAQYLAALIASTAAGGAEVAAVVAITPHICAPQLISLSPLPLIDIVTEIAQAVHARDLKRVALLGTRYTIESQMFGRLKDVEIVTPKPTEIDQIHNAYMNIVGERDVRAQVSILRDLAHTFMQRDGAQSILLAGTDLSTVFNDENTDFPALDCARIHVDAIARRLLS